MSIDFVLKTPLLRAAPSLRRLAHIEGFRQALSEAGMRLRDLLDLLDRLDLEFFWVGLVRFRGTSYWASV
jgi:hypothetical protein